MKALTHSYSDLGGYEEYPEEKSPRKQRGSQPCSECGQVGFHKMDCSSQTSFGSMPSHKRTGSV